MPKVTVLMTVYNGKPYLKECIESVLTQAYDDFEFLIVDDGSIDDSIGLIRSYSDNRIKVIENEKNMGQVKSLNIGLNMAGGEYIARIDQDDMMVQGRLNRQVEFLNKRDDITVVGTWGQVVNDKGMPFIKARLPLGNEEIIGTVLFGEYFLMHPSVMFRKEPVIAAGKYNEGFSLAEDYELWTRLLLRRCKFANIPEYLVKFRYHNKSSSRKFNALQLKNASKAMSDFIKNIMGSSDLNGLCDMLINAGLLNKGYWAGGAGSSTIKELIELLESLVAKTILYFNFTKREAHFMKKVFYNRMLSFAYISSHNGKNAGMELYLYCLRNWLVVLGNPKLYLYPLKKLI